MKQLTDLEICVTITILNCPNKCFKFLTSVVKRITTIYYSSFVEDFQEKLIA